MKTKYYIIGSGGFAKEVYFLANETLDETHEFLGFIDLKPLNNTIIVRGREIRVVDEDYFIDNVPPSKDINIYCGIGNPKLLEKLSKRFDNYIFPNLIHPNVIFDKISVELGRGNILTAGCIFTVDIIIGSFNMFNLHTTIGHDVIIGDCNVLNPGTNISGCIQVGSRNLFGTNATVLQMLVIENDNLIGASSLLHKSIKSNSVMVGVPAKKIR
tara:strand:+ start:4092 stop:4733 length:642 start_codon:yes stop_codon:yes gene_type:complete